MSLEEKPLPTDFVVDESIAKAIRAHLKDDKLPCAKAFIVANSHNVTPITVGQTADALNIHLSHCQLGLFGYPGHKKGWPATNVANQPVPPGLEDAIRKAALDNGALACVNAWDIAAHFKISKMLVAYIADQMGVRIGPCQLGAF